MKTLIKTTLMAVVAVFFGMAVWSCDSDEEEIIEGGATLEMTAEGYTEGMNVYWEEELVLNLSFSKDVESAIVYAIPEGWNATIANMRRLTINIPSSGGEGEYTVSILVKSSDDSKIYDLIFTLIPAVYDEAACDEWNEFAASSANNVLLDFSFAGYDHGLSLPPDVSTLGYKTYDVTDYGAIPNDGLSDRDAFLAAIEAAVGTISTGSTSDGATVLQTVSNNSAKAIIYFPEGEYILHTKDDDPSDGITQSIVIRAGDFVIKGAGRDKTKLIMASEAVPPTPDILYSSPVMILLKHYTGFGSLGITVTDSARKGEFSVEVSSTSGIKAGDWVNLTVQNADPDVVATELSPYTASSLWTIATSGVYVDDIHQIASISGNTVTFVEPLMHEIDPSWGWEIKSFSFYENVGVEDLTFVGYAKDDFKHHGSWQDDGGYKPIDFQRTVNSWIRRVGFTSVSEACSIINSANCSAYDITIDGNRGHAAVRSQSSSRIFIGKVVETSDGLITNSTIWGTGVGQYHAAGINARSMGAVIWRCSWGNDSCFESHASQPRASLFDCCTGGWMQSRQGGATEALPNHLADLTVWNFNSTTAFSGIFGWWNGTSSSWKFLPPIIVGFHGETCNFDPDEVIRDSEHGNIVEPESLYEAQLKLRLGYVPAWVDTLK